MKNKAIIRGVKIGVDGNLDDYLDGFWLEGVSGAIDPFVNDNFSELLEDLDCSEQVEWAREQVGKTLFYGDLVAVSFATASKVYIA